MDEFEKNLCANATAYKVQLQQELNNIRQKDMSVSNYTSKIKNVYDSLSSINIHIEEEEMVQVCLGGLVE